MAAKIISILVVAALSTPAFGVANPNVGSSASSVRSPVSDPTRPPSAQQPGLHRSPNPFSTDGNLIVSGHVAGGRHFRGPVPYGSAYEFGGLLEGGSSVEGFMRRSGTGAHEFGYEPYFSSRGTVTRSHPAVPGVIRPPSPGGIDDSRRLPDAGIAGTDEFLGTTDELYRRPRPLERTLAEIESSMLSRSDYFDTGQTDLTLMLDESDWHRIEEFGGLTEQMRQRLASEYDLSPDELDALDDEQIELPEGFEGRRPQMPDDIDDDQRHEYDYDQADVYERMHEFFEQFGRDRPDAQADDEQTDDESEEPEESFDPMTAEQLIEARARGEMTRYSSFASFEGDRFNSHMLRAEQMLKQGQFYNAADAYRLASMYRPADPLAVAGRSHAMFGAGEYLTSALLLNRAIEMFPGYAAVSIDIVEMFDDRDVLESRLAAAQRLSEQTEVGEFDLLLAYYYHHMGRSDRADEAARRAAQRLEHWPAAGLLHDIITQQ